MSRIGWTRVPVIAANTNRDGSGTVYEITATEGLGRLYVDRIVCQSMGTNVGTEAVIIASNGQGVGDPRNNYILGNADLAATTIGTALATDIVTFTIDAWLPADTELFALVHDAQAAGRQFVAYSDPSYQAKTYP